MLDRLLAHPGVREVSVLRGQAGVLALHGGIEEHTAEIADRAATVATASQYAVVQPDDLRWHVPSIEYDPRHSSRLRLFLQHVRLVVSVHGFGRQGLEESVLVGGGNRTVAARIGAALRAHTALRVIDDLEAIPTSLRGVHPRNPVNLPELGGVQLELSPQARRPEPAAGIAAAIAAVLETEQRSICVAAG